MYAKFKIYANSGRILNPKLEILKYKFRQRGVASLNLMKRRPHFESGSLRAAVEGSVSRSLPILLSEQSVADSRNARAKYTTLGCSQN